MKYNDDMGKEKTIIFLAVLIAAALLSAVMFWRDQPSQEKIIGRLESWSKPRSLKTGYPISNTNGGFSIYSFDSMVSHFIDEFGGYHGGEARKGNAAPIVSPDLFYTAYSNYKDGTLHVVANETMDNKVIVQTNPENTIYISGWSPDSSKFIFNISHELDVGVSFVKNAEAAEIVLGEGFYLFNLDDGIFEKLKIGGFASFINDDTVLVYADDNYKNENMAVFNLNSYDLYNLSNNPEQPDQFSFSYDGRKWVFTEGWPPSSGISKIIYADFPSYVGIQVDFGGFADVQWPILSPNNLSIAYQKDNNVWIFNAASGNKKSLNIEGMPKQWIDENNLVIAREGPNYIYTNTELYLVNVNSGQIIEIK